MSDRDVLRSGDYAMTRADFGRVRDLIYNHAGISLTEAKVDMVYSRLVRRLRATGKSSFAEYLAYLQGPSGKSEWQSFVNSLTTNLTSFFREPHHFETLFRHLADIRRTPVTIWCSAASTGEEPYSIAMTCCEFFNTLTPPVKILATDLDTQVLETATQGIYPKDRLTGVSEARLKQFFFKGVGSQEGQARVRPELQRLITFRPLNLLGPDWPLRGPFDAIFCRNVMIYFDKPTQLKVLERQVPLLSPDGLYFAGHSESFHNAGHLVRLRDKTVYERVCR